MNPIYSVPPLPPSAHPSSKGSNTQSHSTHGVAASNGTRPSTPTGAARTNGAPSHVPPPLNMNSSGAVSVSGPSTGTGVDFVPGTPSMGSVAGAGPGANPGATYVQGPPSLPPPHHPHQSVAWRQYLTDLSTSLFSFVLPLLPTPEELATKEEVRVLIEKLIKTIEPSSRLLSFGSSCNSFGLRNSDMDLVCLIDNKEAALHASDLVQMIGDLLERETNFEVKPLPKARIPIIKLTLNPSPGLPFGIACDIGFENRLALENTRLLLTYATIDPARIRTLVLFLKVWSKRRKINSPYKGTLSSYGFTLMVLFYFVHVKKPPVLPNLQRIAPLRPMSKEEMTLEGRDVWFFDDTETLRKEWSSANFESVGELLIDFFRYYSHDFQYNNTVISIRAGHLTKESKGWMNDIDVGGLNENGRDRNRLCIEDPFETPYNVARTVTKDGLYTIRGEFMRATRILTARPERAVLALAELCIEREDELARAPRSASPAPRVSSGGGGGRGGFGPNPAWRSQMAGGPLDRLSPTLNSLLGPNDAEEFGRRSYSHMGRRGRQPETGAADRHMSAQDMWLANQNFGLDGPYAQFPRSGMGVGSHGSSGGAASGAGGYSDPSRGRDTHSRHLDPAQVNAGLVAGRGLGSVHDRSVEAMLAGSVSAPISPVKSVTQLHEPSRGGYSGTWSTGVSPRANQATRLPNVGDPRNYPSAPNSRRTSGAGGGNNTNTNGGGNGSRSPPMNTYGFNSMAATGRYPAYAQAQSQNNSRRAFSQGPASHSGAGAGTGAGSGYSAQFGTVDPIPSVSHVPAAPPPGSQSPLPAFQPFSTSPIGSGMLHPSAAAPNATPRFISPSALLSPEPVGLELVGGRDVRTDPFPAYHSRQEGEPVGTDSVDAIASGMGRVALGLEDLGQRHHQSTGSNSNGPLSSGRHASSFSAPPSRKPSQ